MHDNASGNPGVGVEVKLGAFFFFVCYICITFVRVYVTYVIRKHTHTQKQPGIHTCGLCRSWASSEVAWDKHRVLVGIPQHVSAEIKLYLHGTHVLRLIWIYEP